jgi:hypothetical protein
MKRERLAEPTAPPRPGQRILPTDLASAALARHATTQRILPTLRARASIC